MFALTIDQRGSRRSADAVPALLASLERPDLVRGFERTAGDEVQGLTDRAEVLVSLVLQVARTQEWWVGVGVGEVEQPVPDSVRASRGAALVAARAAVERAKQATAGVAVEAGRDRDQALVRDAETALQVLAALVADRSPEGHEAVAAMEAAATQVEAARRLGISPQAMSRRLQVARRQDELRLRELAERLADRAEADRPS